MDFDNDYYLAKFESEVDYNNVLSKGPWSITLVNLVLDLIYVSTIRCSLGYIPDLSRSFYKRSILMEIWILIRKVVKIDLQTNKGSRG